MSVPDQRAVNGSQTADLPRVGVGVPSFGPRADPEAIVTIATAAERLGFDSVWTFERLLLPVMADGTNPYGLPDHNGSVYDPLETLTWVAAHTRRIGLGTLVMDPLFQSPLVLARRLATLDRLSGGRLMAGIGQGWMPEEFEAVGVPMARRGAGFEEHVAAMRACWRPDPVEYLGRWYRIPRSTDRTEARERPGPAARRWDDQARRRACGPAGRRLRGGVPWLGLAAQPGRRGSATRAALGRSSCASTRRRSTPPSRATRSRARSDPSSTTWPEPLPWGSMWSSGI